jgi:hypothetical protein
MVCSAVLAALATFASLVQITPSLAQMDPNQMVNALENAGGKFEGFRHSGGKGLCAMAEFVGNTDGLRFSRLTLQCNSRNLATRSTVGLLHCQRTEKK